MSSPAATLHPSDSTRFAEIRNELEALYPGALSLLLVPLCSPSRPHQHKARDGEAQDCASPGKRALGANWNRSAVEAWRAGSGRNEHLDEMARHVASGGNVGWVVPPGVLVIDADTASAVAWLDSALPDAPMQETAKGAHFVVSVPADAAINATVRLHLAPGVTADLRSASRSQIAVEPSEHASGAAYSWKRPLPRDLAELPACPAAFLDRIAATTANAAKATGSALKIGEGRRNSYLYRIGCGMRGRGLSAPEIRQELHRENERYCHPPLDEGEVEAIVATVLRYVAGEASNGDPRRFFGDGGLIVPRLGDEVRALANLAVGIDGRLYRYALGVYRGDGEPFARSEMRKLLGDLFKSRHLDEVIAYLNADFASVTDRQPEGLINLRDGMLEWRADRPTLHDHAPEIISTVQIPHRWRPEARCPRIQAFLGAVVPDAADFVLELIGYALLAANPLRVAVLLLGPGRNGKSVLLAVIKALLGAENVSAIPLQALAEHRFAAAEMFGKLANICGDLDARAVRQTDVFKMLTGGDPIMGERKHRDPFTFTPFALPIFSANEAPLSSDQTEAWFDRWLIVPMPRRIPESEIDPHLTAKLTTPYELEGLLVLAVEGLRRLMARGRFDLPPTVREARAAYRERLDTVAGFVSECCELAPEAWTERPALYRAYRSWATEGGRLPVSAATFNDHLRAGFGERLQERKRHGRRGWAGIHHGGAL